MNAQNNKNQLRITEEIDTISVIWHKKQRVLSILTRHGYIHIYPERRGNTMTILQTTTDRNCTERRRLNFMKSDSRAIYETTLTGYTPDEITIEQYPGDKNEE